MIIDNRINEVMIMESGDAAFHPGRNDLLLDCDFFASLVAKCLYLMLHLLILWLNKTKHMGSIMKFLLCFSIAAACLYTFVELSFFYPPL